MANQIGDASDGRPSGKVKPLNSIEHKTSKSTKAWIKKELAQQQKRFKQIYLRRFTTSLRTFKGNKQIIFIVFHLNLFQISNI